MKYKLGEICLKVTSGGTPKSTNDDYYNGGNIPWLNTKEVNFNRIYDTEKKITELGLSNSSAKMIEKNNVIIAMYGVTAGHVAINKIPLTTNQACCNLKINPELASYEYVYYYLLSKYTELSSLANGGAQQNLNSLIIKNFEIDLPDLETQQKIVCILSALDSKIELNNQKKEKILEISKAYYESLKDGLGNKKTKLSEVAKIKYGKGLSTKNISEEGYPVYGGNGIIGCYKEKMYDLPQILISCRGAASGNVIVARGNCFVTNNSLILECDRKYYHYLKEYSLHNKYYQYTTGSAQPQITIDSVKDIELPLPADSQLEEINQLCNPLEEKYFSIEQENDVLSQVRNTLLPKLMNGEINLDDTVL